MSLINIRIKRIAMHQIFQRDEQGNKIPPEQSVELVNFNDKAMQTFKERFVEAIGEQSKAVEMSIIEEETDKVPSIVNSLRDKSNEEFLKLSVNIANKLTDAQTHRSIPGGIIVVFDGLYGATSESFVGIMKADIHSAYQKTKNIITKEIGLEFVEEVLLTPSSKLYKTAAFFNTGMYDEDNSNDLSSRYRVMISDSQISHTDGKAAARYFYDAFLGCGYPITSARTTKQYYDATRDFINGMNVSEEEKSIIHTALVIYLKEKTDIIDPSEFGDRHFDTETCDLYSEYLEDNDLPSTAFTKDNEYIANKLKLRRLSFGQNVRIIAPVTAFKEIIEMESISEHDGKPVNWTKVIIKDRIVSQ